MDVVRTSPRLARGMIVAGLTLYLLAAATFGYVRWSEWRHEMLRPAAPPAEVLPDRLHVPAVPTPSGVGR